MSRFEIRLDSIWRAPLLLIGASPSRAYVELSDDALEIHFGGYHETIPRGNVADAKRRDWPWYYGIGVRVARHAVGYVGTTKNVVQVDLIEPHRFRILFGWRVKSKGVAVSFEDPEGFLDALGAPS